MSCSSNVVAMVNLGMRRTGLAPGTEDERDPAQVRLAIEAIRAMLPLLEQAAPEQVAAIRDGAVAAPARVRRIGARPPAQAPPAPSGVRPRRLRRRTPRAGAADRRRSPGEPGPAQRSGRLWVPGQ